MKILLPLVLILNLIACGGGGGGGPTVPLPEEPQQPEERTVVLDNPSAMSNALSIDGLYEKQQGSIPAPTSTSGGTLNSASELALTDGGTSQFSLDVSGLQDGYSVHAYLLQFDGVDETIVVPVNSSGDVYSTQSRIFTAESDEAQSRELVNATRTRTRLSCEPGGPGVILELPSGATGYRAPARVQAYVQTGTPASTVPNLSDLLNDPSNWTNPIDVDFNFVDVGSGDFQITLTWDSTADVDLWLEEPNGHKIYYASRNSTAGDGYLDRDDTNGFGPENIYFDQNIPSGTYVIKVKMFSGYGQELPTGYTITKKVRGSSEVFTGSLDTSGEVDTIDTFTIN